MDARKGSQGSELHFEVGGWGWAGLRPAEGGLCEYVQK